MDKAVENLHMDLTPKVADYIPTIEHLDQEKKSRLLLAALNLD
jgi:hypothetical protein